MYPTHSGPVEQAAGRVDSGCGNLWFSRTILRSLDWTASGIRCLERVAAIVRPPRGDAPSHRSLWAYPLLLIDHFQARLTFHKAERFVGHSDPLFGFKLRKHGQGNDLTGDSLGDREVPGLVAQ